MAVTQEEVLRLFDQVAAIKNSDMLLLVSASQDGTVHATKITAELARAYLNKGFEVNVGADGYLYIGGKKTESKVAGITPILDRGDDGIYVSTDDGQTWQVVAYYSDLGNSSVVHQTSGEVAIRPNCLNVWGAMTGIAVTFLGGDAKFENEYKLQFTVSGSDFALALPSSVRWADEPEWEDGWTYQVSVENDLAISKGWAAS